MGNGASFRTENNTTVFSFTVEHLDPHGNIAYIFVIPEGQQIDQQFATELVESYPKVIELQPHILLAFPRNTQKSESYKLSSNKQRIQTIEMPLHLGFPLNFRVITDEATDKEIFQEIVHLAVQIDARKARRFLDETLRHKLKRKQSICYCLSIIILIIMGCLAVILYGSGKKDYKE
jgi:hypothetical protein